MLGLSSGPQDRRIVDQKLVYIWSTLGLPTESKHKDHSTQHCRPNFGLHLVNFWSAHWELAQRPRTRGIVDQTLVYIWSTLGLQPGPRHRKPRTGQLWTVDQILVHTWSTLGRHTETQLSSPEDSIVGQVWSTKWPTEPEQACPNLQERRPKCWSTFGQFFVSKVWVLRQICRPDSKMRLRIWPLLRAFLPKIWLKQISAQSMIGMLRCI